MDMNQVMQLAQNPQVQQLVKSLIQQFAQGKGGQANLQGLVSQLQQGGLGDQVQSWLQQGSNQPVTGQQIQAALGTGTLDQAAAEAGLAPEEAANDLAKVVPAVVDQASPNGQLDMGALQDILKQLTAGQTR